jgi:signal transduction histidine kinase
VLILTAAALFVDLRRGWSEAAVTRVVIDLGDSPRGGSLTDALARAVGDPSLVLGHVVDIGVVVDEAGGRVALPSGETDRAVTSIEAGDGVAAVLVHDRAALRAPGLADSVAAAVRLALDNVGLESQIRGRVRDVEASRARLLAARDSELRDLDTRLRAGVEPRLERAAQALAGLERDPEPLVRVLTDDLRRAREEVARFAAGLHPVGLDVGGLPQALDALAATSPLRVDLTVACGRLAQDVELAAWFVCSEALANVVKHAAAGRVTISAELCSGRLLVTVADDGRGGADPAAGRGLRGLAARVEAAGGRLEVGERPGGGTLLRASLPARERA